MFCPKKIEINILYCYYKLLIFKNINMGYYEPLGKEYDELYETIVGVSDIKENAGWYMNTHIWTGKKKSDIHTMPDYSYHYGFYRFKYNSCRRKVKVYTIMCYCNVLDMIIPLINTNYNIDVNRYATNYGLLRTHYMYSKLNYLLNDRMPSDTCWDVSIPIFYKETEFTKIDNNLGDANYVFCPILIDTRKGLLFGIKYLLHLFGGHFPVIKTFYKYLGGNYNEQQLDYYNPQLDYFDTNIIPIEFPFICNSINHLYKLYQDGLLNVGYYHQKCLIVLTEDAYMEDGYYIDIFDSLQNMIKIREKYILDFFLNI